MHTFWVFAPIDGDGIKHSRQFESPTGPSYARRARLAPPRPLAARARSPASSFAPRAWPSPQRPPSSGSPVTGSASRRRP